MLSARKEWHPKVKRLLAAQYRNDRTAINQHLAGVATVHDATHAVTSALTSRDIQNAWSAVYNEIAFDVGADFAGNTADHITNQVSNATRNDSGLRSDLAKYAAVYAALQAAGITNAIARTITRRIDDGIQDMASDGHVMVPAIATMDDVRNVLDSMYDIFATDGADAQAEYVILDAGNAGAYIGADNVDGVAPTKQWSAIIDEATRPWHAEMDGVEVAMYEPFDVDGEQLLFPTDDSLGATPRNTRYCRCLCLYLVNGVEESEGADETPA